MPWTNPTTRSTGDLITAAIWNTDLVDNLRFVHDRAVTRLYAPFGTLSNLGDFSAVIIQDNANATVRFTFEAPPDFSSLISLEVLVRANFSGARTLSLASDYAAEGEDYGNHSGTSGASYTFTTSVLDWIDVSGVFSSLAAGDTGGLAITVSGGPGGANQIAVLGLRLRYLRT